MCHPLLLLRAPVCFFIYIYRLIQAPLKRFASYSLTNQPIVLDRLDVDSHPRWGRGWAEGNERLVLVEDRMKRSRRVEKEWEKMGIRQYSIERSSRLRSRRWKLHLSDKTKEVKSDDGQANRSISAHIWSSSSSYSTQITLIHPSFLDLMIPLHWMIIILIFSIFESLVVDSMSIKDSFGRLDAQVSHSTWSLRLELTSDILQTGSMESWSHGSPTHCRSTINHHPSLSRSSLVTWKAWQLRAHWWHGEFQLLITIFENKWALTYSQAQSSSLIGLGNFKAWLWVCSI